MAQWLHSLITLNFSWTMTNPGIRTDLKMKSYFDPIQQEVVALVESSRRAAARQINALMAASYWEIGRRIVDTEQH